MQFKLCVLILYFFITCFSIVGCSDAKTIDEKLLGTWEQKKGQEVISFTLLDNGTVIFGSKTGEWCYANGVIILRTEYPLQLQTIVQEIEEDSMVLISTDVEELNGSFSKIEK